MSKKTLFLLLSAVLISSCGPKGPDQSYFEEETAYTEYVRETTTTVYLSPFEIPEGTEAREAIWDEALDQGMRDIINQYVTLSPLVQASKDKYPHDAADYVKMTSHFEPKVNDDIGEYVHTFDFKARFVPDSAFFGQVMALQRKDSQIAGYHDGVYIRLLTPRTGEGPAYFLLGRRPDFVDEKVIQIFGSGKITQFAGMSAMGQLLECNWEVEQGDLIFLLQVEGEPVIEETETVQATATTDEVIVEPMAEPKPVETPKEAK